MKFELGQVNLQLCFIDVHPNILKKYNCNDIINEKNSQYEPGIAHGLFCEIINYIKNCKKEKIEPEKTVYFLTHKPTLDLIDKKIHALNIWKYVDVKRVPIDGFTLADIKGFAKQYKNIVFVNLNCIVEFDRALHYNDKQRQTLKLCKDVKKDFCKIAKNNNVSLTFGYMLPQENWLESHIEETKDYYSNCKEYPYERIQIAFSESFPDGTQTITTYDYDEGVLVGSKKYDIVLDEDVQIKKAETKKEDDKPKHGLFRFASGWKKPN